MKLSFSAWSLCCLSLLSTVTFAAEEVDLTRQPATFLSTYISKGVRAQSDTAVMQTSQSIDLNQTTHIRVQQTYRGYPVWGSEAVVHLPKTVAPSLTAVNDKLAASHVSMDGVFYRELPKDLVQSPAYIFHQTQADHALKTAIRYYRDQTHATFTTSKSASRLMVYVDDKQRAHWAFYVTFKTSYVHGMPAKPVYILDAVTFAVYEHWNNLKTSAGTAVSGGGIGGNGRIGKMIYDGLAEHRPVLNIERNDTTRICYLRNDSVIIRDKRYRDEVPSFRCEKQDNQHNNVYWNTVDDAVNGGYSPNNDGLYSDKMVRDMYQQWFGIPMLIKDGKPRQVTFYVHDPLEEQNAYYEDGIMVFGDGDNESYPVVAPSVVAHEMSHGFTEQYSNLNYRGQPGGINESFSDMADKSIEYYMYGKNNWEIDAELVKDGGQVLRFMDEPTKDCDGKREGQECSISHFKNYRKHLNVHHSSGIFNKAFYLIASQWDTRRAFEVMVQANRHYWTANANFAKAACGVVKAARDYKYDEKTVKDAMREVGVSTTKC